jgi:hypothetical protein
MSRANVSGGGRSKNKRRAAVSSLRGERNNVSVWWVAAAFLGIVSVVPRQGSLYVTAANGYDDYYGYQQNNNGNDDQYNQQNYQNNGGYDDQYQNNAGYDDQYNNGGGGGDDFYQADDNYDAYDGDDYSVNNRGDDGYFNQNQYQDNDDDTFHWDGDVGFGGVSIMPLSCINYNSGHMIKFQLFDTAKSYQCHFAEISTFVVSISHYMRAYFNYLALTEGRDFQLPDDAAYLNVSAIGFREIARMHEV